MRTKLVDRKLPNYSIAEERFNYISHIVGGVVGVMALISWNYYGFIILYVIYLSWA